MKVSARWPVILVLQMVALWVLMPMTFRYGYIWDSQIHPKEDVEVVLPTGTTLRGELSRTWAGDFELRVPDGRVLQFRDYVSMSSKLPSADQRDGFVTKHWRQIVPTAMLALASILVAIPLIRHGK